MFYCIEIGRMLPFEGEKWDGMILDAELGRATEEPHDAIKPSANYV